MIPFLDLGRLHASIRDELDEAFDRVVSSSAFVGGEGAELEEEFAAAHGRVGSAGCGSGTDALSLALRAAGIGPGDEVVVPSMTFVATAEAVVHVGATPVIADVDATDLLLGPDQVDAVRTDRTRAVIPVHLYGHVVPFDRLATWRDEGLIVIEDAAQAHLAEWQGRSVGTIGHAACFSFYPGKNLGAFGDAGAITTNDADLAARLRMLRNYGSSVRYVHRVQGRNSRLDPIQAALLGVKLAHLDEWNARRRAIAARYLSALAGTGVVLPEVPAWADPVWHLFCVRHSQRDALRLSLEQAGVETLIHYPIPPHLQDAYAAMRLGPGAFPIAEETASTILSLPIGPAMTGAQVDRVIEAVTAAAPA